MSELALFKMIPGITHPPDSSRPLEDGDIVNVDVTVYIDGYHGDTSRTFLVGDVVSFSSSPNLRSCFDFRDRTNLGGA